MQNPDKSTARMDCWNDLKDEISTKSTRAIVPNINDTIRFVSALLAKCCSPASLLRHHASMSVTVMFSREIVLACMWNEQTRCWTPLPSIIYGVLASLSGLLYLLLPETLGQSLRNTTEEVEQLDASFQIWWDYSYSVSCIHAVTVDYNRRIFS